MAARSELGGGGATAVCGGGSAGGTVVFPARMRTDRAGLQVIYWNKCPMHITSIL